MSNCDHLVGMSRTTVSDANGNVITTWLTEVRASRAHGRDWSGYDFNYCPECGADVREIVRNRVSNLKFTGLHVNRNGDA
jgi:hypothetical protein